MAYDPKIVIDNKHKLTGKGFEVGKPIGFDENGNLVNVDVETGVPYRKVTLKLPAELSPNISISTEE